MKRTVNEMYSEMISENESGNWINPRLEPIKNPEFPNHFMIKLDDFRDIHESVNVSIYNIRKWPDGIVIHCKQDYY